MLHGRGTPDTAPQYLEPISLHLRARLNHCNRRSDTDRLHSPCVCTDVLNLMQQLRKVEVERMTSQFAGL